jgi:hypothetical protein
MLSSAFLRNSRGSVTPSAADERLAECDFQFPGLVAFWRHVSVERAPYCFERLIDSVENGWAGAVKNLRGDGH